MGVASAFMGLTKTVHPPAGATALLCSAEPAITELGWLFLPLILLGTTLLLVVACVLNNIQRQFPIYWWTPTGLSRSTKDDIETASCTKGKVDKIKVRGKFCFEIYDLASEGRIIIDKEHIIVPDGIALEYEERAMLEILRTKLRG